MPVYAADAGPVVILMVIAWVLSAVFGGGQKKPPPGPGPEKPGRKPKGFADVLRQIEEELRKASGEAGVPPPSEPDRGGQSERVRAAAARGAEKASKSAPSRPIAMGTPTRSEHEAGRDLGEVRAARRERTRPLREVKTAGRERTRRLKDAASSEHEAGEGKSRRLRPAPRPESGRRPKKSAQAQASAGQSQGAAPAAPAPPKAAQAPVPKADAFSRIGESLPPAARALLWSEILREPPALRAEDS